MYVQVSTHYSNVQVLLVGPHSGKKVQEAKKLIQGDMVASGEAVLYQEPERSVTTRSGDQCVVALTNQWWVGPSSSRAIRASTCTLKSHMYIERFSLKTLRCKARALPPLYG